MYATVVKSVVMEITGPHQYFVLTDEGYIKMLTRNKLAVRPNAKKKKF